ncbi:Putative undecaprenyl-diphosphatase YbjG [Serratia symbiotica]|nr:Putative undecaprenyl-diphosphatase YbjG [Serratia symbiotica]
MDRLNYLIFPWINASPASPKWLIAVATFLARDAIALLPLLLIWLWLGGPKSKLISQREVVAKTITALLLSMLVSAVIRKLLPHDRPFVARIGHLFLAHEPDSSFPSNHGTAIFTFGLAFLFWYRIWLGGLLMIVAMGIAWSRIYLGIHWPLDMVSSFLIGLVSCLVTHWVWSLCGEIIASQLTRLFRFLFIHLIRKS